MKKNIIIVRGGGDIATGTIYKLHQSGYPVLVTEIANPSAIRRQVAFSEAVYEKSYTVEGVTCYFAENLTRAYELLKQRKVALMIDPDGAVIREVKPAAVVDGILAKKNLGTTMDMAPFTVALGPGFTAGVDVHAVVETMRGHKLGRIIYEGNAIPNTGIPGNIGGFTKERVIHAPAEGFIKNIHQIGDVVEAGTTIARIYENMDESGNFGGSFVPVQATITGIIRGLIREGYHFPKGFKIADIDPREGELKNCFTISDKARSIGGSVLEAVCRYIKQDGRKNMNEKKLTHFNESGEAHMVDVHEKADTYRVARAEGTIFVNDDAFVAISQGTAKKGDVLGIARIAGIMGAKNNASLIPLCHPIAMTKCDVDFKLDKEKKSITATCTTACVGKTGVEMEALSGVSAALLTIYDMCKALDRGMEITEIHLLEKAGGKSGHFKRK